MKNHLRWTILFAAAAALAGCAPTGYGGGAYDDGYRYGGYGGGGYGGGYRYSHGPRQWGGGFGYGQGHPDHRPRDNGYPPPPDRAEPPGAYYRERPSRPPVYSPIGYPPQGGVSGPSGVVNGSGPVAPPTRGPRLRLAPGQEGVVMDR